MISLRRRILFFTFTAIFVIATPLIVLYSIGYKINLSHPFSLNSVQKTGMIIFETEPEGATIYINDKREEELLSKLIFKKTPIKTPAKIKGLFPEEYNVRLELEGYWPWKKKLTVSTGQITHAQNIKLFKRGLPVQIAKLPMQEISISPDKKKAFLGKEGLIINLKTEEKTEILKTENKDAYWSKDNKKILIENTIFDIKNPEKAVDLEKLIGKDLKNIKWDKNNTNKLYYQYKNSLSFFDLGNNSNKNLINNENILDYSIKDGRIFIIAKNGIGAKLKIYSLDAKKMIKEIELPPSDGYRLINQDHFLTNLYDERYKILYLINPFSLINPLEEIISNVKYAHWTDDKNILYANDFEIWSLNLEEGKKDLLMRISQPITNIIKKKDSNYIIYSTNKSINILERDENGRIQITELINLDEISSPTLDENEDILYFNAKIGNQEGLYKLDI